MMASLLAAQSARIKPKPSTEIVVTDLENLGYFREKPQKVDGPPSFTPPRRSYDHTRERKDGGEHWTRPAGCHHTLNTARARVTRMAERF
jgi:hypothetical protein